jgi:hypothetical protein
VETERDAAESRATELESKLTSHDQALSELAKAESDLESAKLVITELETKLLAEQTKVEELKA